MEVRLYFEAFARTGAGSVTLGDPNPNKLVARLRTGLKALSLAKHWDNLPSKVERHLKYTKAMKISHTRYEVTLAAKPEYTNLLKNYDDKRDFIPDYPTTPEGQSFLRANIHALIVQTPHIDRFKAYFRYVSESDPQKILFPSKIKGWLLAIYKTELPNIWQLRAMKEIKTS